MFAFAPARRSRRPSLTPMIDVVFLLLVFFMLAARFGQEQSLPVTTAGAGTTWSGPPRLVEVAPDALRLNGVVMAPAELLNALATLTGGPDDPVVIRPRDAASLQRLVDVMEMLRDGGHVQLLVVE